MKNERLFGFAYKFNYNSLLGVFRELAPERQWPENRQELQLPSTMVENARSIELLRRFGAGGWVPFFESVRRSCTNEYGDGYADHRGDIT